MTWGMIIGFYFMVRMFTDGHKKPTYRAYIKDGKRINKTPEQMIKDPHSR